MIKKYKKHLLASSIVILLPMVLGIFLWKFFPEKLVIHWNIQGEKDGYGSKAFALFIFPLILLLLHWLCIFFTAKDRKNEDQSRKIFIMIIWLLPIISIFIWGTVFSASFGISFEYTKIALTILPFTSIVLGNYMPKCKQNYTIGIRVSWTLQNEENWNKTHRFAGRYYVYSGILMVVVMLCIPLDISSSLIVIYAFMMAFVPVGYSYVYYRKQLKDGKIQKEQTKKESGQKKTGIVTGIFVLVGILILVMRGDYSIRIEEKAFTVDAKLWEDITVSYDSIEKIEYLDHKKSSLRTFGYGSLSVVMGDCYSEVWGEHTAYLYLKTNPCIVLTVDGKILVINERDEEQTRDLYEKLILCIEERS